MLGALLILKRGRSGAERLSYKGLDVEQIGHVYEGLLEFSCLRVEEPYLGLIGKLEPELPLPQIEGEAGQRRLLRLDGQGVRHHVRGRCARLWAGAPDDLAALHAACDNDAELTERVRPLRGLLRRDLRGLPTVFPAGSLVITQVGDRRATGTHYTPRKLAEEIVKYTLEPLCYSPGPADGPTRPTGRSARPPNCSTSRCWTQPWAPERSWCPPAGSWANAWSRPGSATDIPDAVQAALGPDFDRDDAALEARRRVAARCMYGVDRDEAAVELGKLSLWLVTLAKGQPFSFLDHALRCGDSLVGLISESQIEAFHLDPETGRRINARLSGAIDDIVGPILTRVRELREEIEAEPVRDPRQAQALAAKLAEADRLTDRLRDVADAVAAAALSTAGQSADAFDCPTHQPVRGSPANHPGRDRVPTGTGVPRQTGRLAPRPPPRTHPPPPLGPGVPRSNAPRRLQRHRQQPAVHGRPEAHRPTRRRLARVPDPATSAEASAAAPTYAPTSCSAISRSPQTAGPESSPPTRSPRATRARWAWIRPSTWDGRFTGRRNLNTGPERQRWR